MTLSRRNFLLGSAAAVVAASPVVRAIAAPPVYGGEVGKWDGVYFMGERGFYAFPPIAAMMCSWDESEGFVMRPIPNEDFYVVPVHPSMAADLRA